MLRYSIREVVVGSVPNIPVELENKISDSVFVVMLENEQSHICAIDWEKREAIDIFEPEKRYPLIGKQEYDYVVVDGPVDENKEYALKIEDSPYSYLDQKRMLKQLRRNGII